MSTVTRRTTTSRLSFALACAISDAKTTKRTALLLILLCTSAQAQSLWQPVGANILGEAHGDAWGTQLDVNQNGTVIAASAYGNDGNGNFAGHVRSFEWNGAAWLQRGADIDGLAAQDRTNQAALDQTGTVLAVGSAASSGTGYVRVFDWNGSSWVLRGNVIIGEAGASFGSGVDLSGDGNSVAIGADQFNGINGSRSGRTRIFDWNGATWVQRGASIDGAASDDFSGRVVKLSADSNTVAINAPGNDTGGNLAGQVRVFDWNGMAWMQRGGDLNGFGNQVGFGFDLSLSADGRRLAVGCPTRSINFVDDGEAKVFDWTGATWRQVGQTLNDGDGDLDRFGGSVSLSAAGDRLVVGGHEYTETTGTTRSYRLNGGTWQKLGADLVGLSPGERFGTAVALSGDGATLVSSAPLWKNSANQELGYVRVFKDSAPIFRDSFE